MMGTGMQGKVLGPCPKFYSVKQFYSVSSSRTIYNASVSGEHEELSLLVFLSGCSSLYMVLVIEIMQYCGSDGVRVKS